MNATGSDVTLVQNAIHNPQDPRHFMTVTELDRQAVASVGGIEIASSSSALVVKEVARAIYDPVVYFPRGDVHMNMLESIDRTTHCPLKGDTEYFDIVTPGGRAQAAAWSYVKMVAGDELKDYVAFDVSLVHVDVHPGL